MIEELSAQIESAIVERRVDIARRLITRYLNAQKHSPAACLAASEYYRRMGEPNAALRVLRPERVPTPLIPKYQLQEARLLNLLGASSYALKIVERQRSHWSQDRELALIAGAVLYSNYRSADALPIYEPFAQTPIAKASYRERFQRVILADLLFGVGKHKEARELLLELIQHSTENLLLAVCHQALAAQAIQLKQLKISAQHLEASAHLFKDDDNTPDRGFLEKWQGAYHALQGNAAQAHKHLKRAWQILYRPGVKPEGWLEVLYWQGLLRNKARRLPEEWKLILVYPSPGHRLQGWIEEHGSLPTELRFGATPAKTQLLWDLRHDTLTHKKGHQLGLSLPDTLSALCCMTGKAGLPQYRLYETLWPDEHFSFANHQKRLEQVVMRSRELGEDIAWADLHLRSQPSKASACLWARTPAQRGGDFLAKYSSFTKQELQAYFGLSERAAAYVIAEWKQAGLIAYQAGHYQRCK